ncbi:MAG: carbohydrate porin [Myxococcota bacterium]|nr:carbohydrate porin [Myxococcota bacterium]
MGKGGRAHGPPRSAALAGTVGVCLVLAAAAAQGEPAPTPRNALARHLLDSRRLLGDPGGQRGRLELLGVELQLFYNQFLAWKPRGGGVNEDSVFGHSGSYDFFTRVDVEALTGWPGLDVLLHVKGQYDENLNDDVGALSNPIDDADFDEPIWVSELWFEQALFENRLRVRFGRLEQQTLFDRNAYANSEDRQFMTTFLDNNAVVPLPSGLGAALIAVPVPGLEIALGAADADNSPRAAGWDTAFDGVDSLTGYLELTWRTGIPSPTGPLPGVYRAGMFVDGRKLEVFGRTNPDTGLPRTERGHLGAYLSVDQLALRERPESAQGLGLFARFGYADRAVNRIAWFWSLGLQYVGALPTRDADVLAFGVYQAIGSGRYRDEVDSDFDHETGIELYYRIAALPWLTVTPDFQFIVDPGATGAADDTAVLVLRFRVTF